MKTINTILSIIILVGFVILGIVLPYREGNRLWTVLSILWLLIEPTKFLYRRQYKRITSKWYQILLFFSQLVIVSFMIYREELSFWVIYSILFVLLFLSIFTKRESYTRKVDISKILLLLIGIISFSTYFNQIDLGLIQLPMAMSLSVFSLLLIFFVDKAKEQNNLQLIYMILMLLALVSQQPICFVLLIRLFLDLDHF